jgi:hypothetical protein
MRRLRTYALGGHFIEPHIFMLILTYLASPGASLWRLWGTLRAFPGVRGLIFYAQAA